MVVHQTIEPFEMVKFLSELCPIVKVSLQQLLNSELVTVKVYLDDSCKP